jgi:hypothetical protein
MRCVGFGPGTKNDWSCSCLLGISKEIIPFFNDINNNYLQENHLKTRPQYAFQNEGIRRLLVVLDVIIIV